MLKTICECGQPVEYPEGYSGRSTNCPECGIEFELPKGPNLWLDLSKSLVETSFRSGRLLKGFLKFFVPLVFSSMAVVACYFGGVWAMANPENRETVMVLVGIVGAVLLLTLAILWVIFPFIVWHYLQRIDKTLAKIQINTNNPQ